VNLLRRTLLAVLLVSIAPALYAQSQQPAIGAREQTDADITLLQGSSKFTFVAYGDIRFTDPTNTSVSDPEARRALVHRIAELKPAFVTITGDLVLKGANRADWEVWQAETKPWRDAGIPVFPVLGNHDLSGDPQAANFFAHAPELKERRWYSVRAGNVLLLLLDSNSDAPDGEQWSWLAQQVAAVPADVDFVVVSMHHPPYTHSSPLTVGGGHSARSNEERLARFLEQRQETMRARIMVLAGHVHNYEHYEHGGVMYIVTGGGGATPYNISRSPQDLYHEPGPAYHFMRLSIDGHVLHAEMIKLDLQRGQSNWAVKDSFQLEAPATGTNKR
jgi:hypothetical protein